jgi:hypothetical protein
MWPRIVKRIVSDIFLSRGISYVKREGYSYSTLRVYGIYHPCLMDMKSTYE